MDTEQSDMFIKIVNSNNDEAKGDLETLLKKLYADNAVYNNSTSINKQEGKKRLRSSTITAMSVYGQVRVPNLYKSLEIVGNFKEDPINESNFNKELTSIYLKIDKSNLVKNEQSGGYKKSRKQTIKKTRRHKKSSKH